MFKVHTAVLVGVLTATVVTCQTDVWSCGSGCSNVSVSSVDCGPTFETVEQACCATVTGSGALASCNGTLVCALVSEGGCGVSLSSTTTTQSTIVTTPTTYTSTVTTAAATTSSPTVTSSLVLMDTSGAPITTHFSTATAVPAQTTATPPLSGAALYGWAIGAPLGTLVLLSVILVLVFKLSSHWHAHVVKTSLKRIRRRLPALASPLPLPGKLRILTLNMFLRPRFIADDGKDDYKETRLRGFCETYLENFDVICLQECFSTMNYRKAWFMKMAVRKGFQHLFESPAPKFCSGKFVDGGLLLLSRLPFEEEPSFMSFTEGVGADGLADKGVIHACVRLPGLRDADNGAGHRVHFFCTHLQAAYQRVDWDAAHVQAHQLAQMREFVDDKTADRPDDHVRPVSYTHLTLPTIYSV